MLKIAIAQISIINASPKKNFECMKHSIEKSLQKKQDLIVFPEMSLPGYFNGDIWEQTAFLTECEFYHAKIAELSENIHVVFGSVGCDWTKKNEDGRVRKYNAAFFASKGNLILNSKTNLPFWPKTLLPNYREFDDSRHFYDLRKLSFEKNCLVQNLYEPVKFQHKNKIISVGLSLCEDGWNDLYSFSPLEAFCKIYPHDFFLNLSCSPFTLGKNNRRETIFSSLAKKINTPILYINCTGTQNIGKTIYGFDGCSAAYQSNGEILNLCPSFHGQLEYVGYDNSPASFRGLTVESTDLSFRGLTVESSNNEIKLMNNYQEIQIALESILKTTCISWNVKKAVVGVSGGIDSALCAALMARVLGKENVFLVNMPSRFNSQLTINAAKDLAQNLGCPYTSVGIEDSVAHSHQQLLQLKFENSMQTINVTNFVLENIQARDRGARILAAIAGALGTVFTCNANKTELTVGYGTLYGDLAGFLCPIADLWKHQIYGLAQFYNQFIFKKEIIPKVTLSIVPSAELSEEQNVLEGKGDPLIYPYHDYLFRSWVEDWERKTPEDCLTAYLKNKIDKMLGCKQGLTTQLFPSKEFFCADLERWWKLYQGLGAVKRMQAPPIVALSRRAFGFDHREHLGEPLLTKKYFDLKDA